MRKLLWTSRACLDREETDDHTLKMVLAFLVVCLASSPSAPFRRTGSGGSKNFPPRRNLMSESVVQLRHFQNFSTCSSTRTACHV